MTLARIIERDPEVLGGAPVFAGTRVPVQTLLDALADGHSLAEFLDDFPSVRRDQAVALLKALKQMLLVESGESAA